LGGTNVAGKKPSAKRFLFMKAYVGTTGVLFALLVVAHFLRIYQERQRLAKDPSFL
jgi:hypothetical protein